MNHSDKKNTIKEVSDFLKKRGQNCMSQELYLDLMNDAKKINELLKLTDEKRTAGKLTVLREPEIVISEQIEEIKMSPIGISREIIEETKKRAFVKKYEGKFDEKVLERTWDKLPKDIKWRTDSVRGQKMYRIDILDILTRKPAGNIVTYKIKQTTNTHEFFKMMGCKNEEEVKHTGAQIAMNIEQARALYQYRMFSESGPGEGMFVNVGEDIKYININHLGNNKNRNRNRFLINFGDMEKDRTLFIFEPKDKIIKENI